MDRTVTLKLYIDKGRPAMDVTHAEAFDGSTGAEEKHSAKVTDTFESKAQALASLAAVGDEWFRRMAKDAVTPIDRAIKAVGE